VESVTLQPLWAKADGKNFHPLICHMLDVGHVAAELWDGAVHGLIRGKVSDWMGLPEDSAGRWLAFFAALHDLGKASPGFQGKRPELARGLKADGYDFPKTAKAVPHGAVTAYALRKLFMDQELCPGGFPRNTAQALASALGGHHGSFISSLEVQAVKSFRHRGNSHWEAARKRFFCQLAGAFRLEPKSFAIQEDPAFFVFLAGLVSVADWIGSSEDYFPYAGEATDIPDYEKRSRQRAKTALQELGWLGWEPVRQQTTFQELFGFPKPRPLQEVTSSLAVTQEPSFLLIEAPMGEGKTEAAMERADSWGDVQGQRGIYFALPSQASSNQMYGRVHEFLNRRYPDDARIQLRLLHGRASFVMEARRLVDDPAFSGENGGRESAVSWFSPKKRGLLAPFGVGTVDQAMMSALKSRHAFVRLFGLAGKTVIIDEVHAYDVYMSDILVRLLEWLRALGTSVVLLSATLPAEKRRKLSQAFSGTLPPEEVPYPRITWMENGHLHCRHVPAEMEKEIHVRQMRQDPEALAREFNQALENGGAAAVVVNTVDRAQEVFRALEDSGFFKPEELLLFHARFPLGLRKEIEDQALSLFGKGDRDPSRRTVLVATQVVEQSLDLDFDLMATDLAPVDLVLQRAGRLHRHSRVRPPGLEKPGLWLLLPDRESKEEAPDFGGSAKIYDPWVLLRSFLVLKDRSSLKIPGGLESLVEAVYGPENIPGTPQAPQTFLDEMAENREENKASDSTKAKMAEIPPPYSPVNPKFFNDFRGDLEDADDPRVHQAFLAKTRLGPPSVNVVCLHRSGDGLFLDASCKEPVDLEMPPTREMEEKLILREASLSHQGIFPILQNTPAPSAWKRNGTLRHHRVLVFENGAARAGDFEIFLDERLGLVIRKPQQRRCA